MKQNREKTIKNRKETREMACQIFLFVPGTSRIAGRRRATYTHIAGRYKSVLMIVFAYTAAALNLSANQMLLSIAALQKKMQNSDA